MRTTCLISNYNYAHFVGEAIDSAMGQTIPFDEIIVVDDGSTDGSVELLRSKYGGNPVVRIVAKDNQGQLSCFNEGFAHATGDIVFFLDADDAYEPDYVEQALDVYDRHRDCDFLYCGQRQFGQRDRLMLDFAEDRDLGYSVVLTAYLRQWIGAPTSCLSMRRCVLEKILPLPFVDAWRVRADDCLVFGSSLAGARKRYLAQPLVRYRVHDNNLFFGRPVDRSANYRRHLAINALFEHLERKLCYNVPRLADFHHREFCTIERPTHRHFVKYLRISLAAQVSPARRLACMAEITRHYVRTALRGAVSARHGAAPSADRDSTLPFHPHVPGEPASTDAVPTGEQQRRAA